MKDGDYTKEVKSYNKFKLILRALPLHLKSIALALHFVVIEFFLRLHECIARFAIHEDEFIKFQMKCFRIAVLGILQEEDHEEGDNGRRRINHELPICGVVEIGTGEEPTKNKKNGADKCPRRPDDFPRSVRNAPEETCEGMTMPVGGFWSGHFDFYLLYHKLQIFTITIFKKWLKYGKIERFYLHTKTASKSA